MAHYDKDIVSDFSVPTDGTNVVPNWQDWLDFLDGLVPGDTWTLSVPGAGSVYSFDTGQLPLAKGIFGGISGTINIASGANFTGNFLMVAGASTINDADHDSRIYSVNRGATSVRLKDIGEVGLWDVGRWMGIVGGDLQGNGAPACPQLLEYRQIIDITGDVLSFSESEPLVYSYKDTWPLYNAGQTTAPARPFTGGPASIIWINDPWDLQLVINCGTGAGDTSVIFERLNGPPAQIYASCRSFIMNGGEVLPDGLIVSGGKYSKLNGVKNSVDHEIEVDKMWELFESSNSRYERVKVQSGLGEMRLDGDVVDSDVQLTKVASIHNVTIGDKLYTGPVSTGFCDSVTISGTTSFVQLAEPILTDDLDNWEWVGDGVFRAATPPSDGSIILRLATIGAWFVFGRPSGRTWGNPFQVPDAWQDATYTYVQTTLTAVPTFSVGTSGFSLPAGEVSVIPCLKVYCTSTDPSAEVLTNAPQGRPFGEYGEYTFSGPQDGTTTQYVSAFGRIVRIVVDVQRLYTGTTKTSCTLTLGQFGVSILDDTNTATRPAGTIDLKAGSSRTITITPSGGVTGAHANDDLGDLAVSGWLMEGIASIITTNGAGGTTGDTSGQQPIVRIQAFTDTGVVLNRTFACSFS